MESGFGGLTFSQIVNSLLYIVSGFFFGIFASRNSLFSVMRIRKAFAEKDFSPGTVFSLAFSFLFLALAFLVFPSWMAARTTVGAFAYYAVLLFYFPKAGRIFSKNNTDIFLFLLKNMSGKCPHSSFLHTTETLIKSEFLYRCNHGRHNISESISGTPKCRVGTKLPWQSLPPEIYNL